jgi:hypothetical protein
MTEEEHFNFFGDDPNSQGLDLEEYWPHEDMGYDLIADEEERYETDNWYDTSMELQ